MGDQAEEPPAEAVPPVIGEMPAAESAHTQPSAGPRPSKSALVDKRASTMSKQMSHVKLVEPGEQAPAHEEERRKSEVEKRKSIDEERRASEAARRSRQLSTGSAGYRASVASQRASGDTSSKEGILRRRSDRPSKAKSAVGSTISIRRASGYGEYLGGAKVK
ncbi:hypothetical protein ILUMI_06224 [Ignelater luminosus]|uniref:Uncharacterized protein n=1 Tax=Ignelater luminosus TaxID=2038154 RepID=A0A8K0DAE3_IGNLU|nr:hypothetical protein ILUMI_06224 [Ignelater luminosus]